ncbi:hypothetical protein EZH22_14825 [Xanthobacter dioxanivorans]|uniref:Uncharacterized protein n=1 Tax=Xanthobacter dioxanivorans TaxID=2528964 RepID=A0A974SGV7_9HYPH|nr:hypothetical protein [Xanthobacter dioxanivorans]QRG04479.1 hypothetical protein EZH22_14825 [Xanthobacter dioxanivorans]
MVDRARGAAAKAKRAMALVRNACSRTKATGAVVAAGIACLAFGGVGETKAANLLELNFWLSGPNYSGVVPACNEQQALDLIASRFAETERRFWDSTLSITEFVKVHEIAFRPWGPQYQPRRYCQGTIYTNDARKRAIYYSIIEDGGFIGATWGVEWCIVGLDRNYAYAPSCKMAGP